MRSHRGKSQNHYKYVKLNICNTYIYNIKGVKSNGSKKICESKINECNNKIKN